MLIERAPRKLSIDITFSGPIVKISENTIWSRFTHIPKWIWISPKQGLFLSVLGGQQFL